MEKCHRRNNGYIKYEIPLITHNKGEHFYGTQYIRTAQYEFENAFAFSQTSNLCKTEAIITQEFPFMLTHLNDCILFRADMCW